MPAFLSREDVLLRLVIALHRRLRCLAEARLRDIIARLEHVRDPRMRGLAFLRRLEADPPEVVVEMLRALEILVRERQVGAQLLFIELLDAETVREVLSPEVLNEIWRLGRIRGYNRMLEVFFCLGDADGRFEEAPRLPPDIRDIPLGRRKAMARTGAIGVLERLILDNDVSVIKNLLLNPRLTEREVVRLTAKRPNSAAILTAVASHRRWISHYAVKKALIYNPDTPVSISAPLLKFLVRADLLELADQTSSNAFLKRAARDLLESYQTRRDRQALKPERE